MSRIVVIALSVVLCSGLGLAQEKKKCGSTATAGAKTSSSGDKTVTKTYRRVIKNGKVVEEEGDSGAINLPGLPDLDELIERCKADAKSSGSTSTHRVVVKNGKVVKDEKGGTGDLKDLPDDVREMIDRMKSKFGGVGGKGHGSTDSSSDRKSSKSSTSSSKSSGSKSGSCGDSKERGRKTRGRAKPSRPVGRVTTPIGGSIRR